MLSDELGSQGSLIYKKQAVIALKHSSVIHITAHPQGSYLRPTGRGRIFRRTKKKSTIIQYLSPVEHTFWDTG